MTAERRIEDPAEGTYGSVEAAAGWRRSGVIRAQVLAPLTERMLDQRMSTVAMLPFRGKGEEGVGRPDVSSGGDGSNGWSKHGMHPTAFGRG